MRPKDTDKQWEQFGRRYPYFGVSAHDVYRAEKPDAAALTAFFTSGEQHVDQLFRLIGEHLQPAFSPARALDFGCGVGRIVIPLAKRVPAVVGVDVAPGMLAEADVNCRREGVENVALLLSDDELSRLDGRFDFIHSYIVFQHIEPRRGEQIVRRLLTRLEDRGVAMLHLTYAYERPVPLFQVARRWMEEQVPFLYRLANLRRGRDFSHPYMMMHHYDLNRIFRLIQGAGCEAVYSQFTNHDGHLGVMLFLQKRAGGVTLS